MIRIWAVAAKELRQVARDPLSLVMLLGVPSFMLLLYGFALNFDVRHIALAVEDRSLSRESRALVSAFVNSSYFDLTRTLAPGSDLERLTRRGEAKAVLVIPADYARTMAAGRTARVALWVDGADARTASTVLGYAEAVVAERNVELAPAGAAGAAAARRTAGIDYQPRVWYNPELSSTQFLVPGLIGFILMLTAVQSTAMSIVREKERGTMEQLRVTALRPGELILGKTLPYLAISLAATALILAAARVLFGVVVRGSYVDLFVATLVYLLGALGLGLLVSSIARSQAMAFQVGSVISMLPAIFLSGFIFPIRSMPAPVQAITYIVPTRYFLVVLRGIILKGAGLDRYGRDLGFLVLYAAVVLAVAYVRLVRRES